MLLLLVPLFLLLLRLNPPSSWGMDRPGPGGLKMAVFSGSFRKRMTCGLLQ